MAESCISSHLILIQKQPSDSFSENGVFQYILHDELLRTLFWFFMGVNFSGYLPDKKRFIVPENDKAILSNKAGCIFYQNNCISFPDDLIRGFEKDKWLVVSNGRFCSQIDPYLIDHVLQMVDADLVLLKVDRDYFSYHERIRLSKNNQLAGYRRFYKDSYEPCSLPETWPHHIYIKPELFQKILTQNNSVFSLSFQDFLSNAKKHKSKICSLAVGGLSWDLNTQEGSLGAMEKILASLDTSSDLKKDIGGGRLIGPVVLGENVTVDKDAVIIGPSVICEGVEIKEKVVISHSIVHRGLTVEKDRFIKNSFMIDANGDSLEEKISVRSVEPLGVNHPANVYRQWPRFSYTRFFKRIADVVLAAFVLILFAPIIPFIMLAIKITSPGPVFFKDRRQGLHGKDFNCLKFRTMIVGADEMQHQLRYLNEADGPQFKMEEDPRPSPVGRFLRDTYLDEIPQFFNVLAGQMSIIGPRPSPEAENVLCPAWRDARLSVKPGISGLWQIQRTREPMKDFQEWIYYDIKYVKNISLKMDLWICWKTALQMLKKFISKF